MKQRKLDAFAWHEALDRSFMLFEVFTTYVQAHPVMRRTPLLRKQTDRISKDLFELYQSVAREDPTDGK